jgi:hypothetical protein
MWLDNFYKVPVPLFMSSKSILSIRLSATKRDINLDKAEKFLHRKLQMGKTKSYGKTRTIKVDCFESQQDGTTARS